MRLRCQLLLACCVAVLPVSRGKAQSPPPATAPDSTRQILHTKDGSTLYGRIVAEDSSTVQFETSGGTLKIERSNIASIKPVHQSDMHDGEYWHPDPNRTRLFVGPTGRLLDGGDGYYQNTYALLQTLVVAPSNRFNLGGGFTLIPGVDPTAWAYYVNPKIGVYQSENVNVAVGGYAGFQPEGDVDGFGFGYGVATFGGLDGNVSGGVGFGRAGKSNSNPVFMLSGSQRISRRLAVMTENYGYFQSVDRYSCPTFTAPCSTQSENQFQSVVSYGFRIIGEKLAVDLAFFNIHSNDNSWIFPGIPYLSFSVKF